MTVRVRSLYTYCMGGWALNRVTGVSNHLIRDSTGHSGFDLFVSLFTFHGLYYCPPLRFLCLRYTMYDNKPFILWQRFRCLNLSESKIERPYQALSSRSCSIYNECLHPNVLIKELHFNYFHPSARAVNQEMN